METNLSFKRDEEEMFKRILSSKKCQGAGDFRLGNILDLSGAKDLLSASGHNTDDDYRVVRIDSTVYAGDVDSNNRIETDIVIQNIRTHCQFCFDVKGLIAKAVKIKK